MAGLRADELFACRDRHGVRYVLIGGLAAVLHGSPLPTVDADICPARTRENLVRLAAALRELEARIRTTDTPAGVPFPCDADFLDRVDLLNLITAAGDVDLSFTPPAPEGLPTWTSTGHDGGARSQGAVARKAAGFVRRDSLRRAARPRSRARRGADQRRRAGRAGRTIAIMKLLAGRTQDLADIEAMIASGADRDRFRATVTRLVPDRVDTLGRLFENADREP